MKKIVIGLLSFAVLVGGLFLLFKFTDHEKYTSTEDEVTQVIVDNFPYFSYNRTPAFRIDSLSSHDNIWYIATIKPLNSTEVSVPVKIILMRENQSSSSLRIILGPDTVFTESEMISYNIPDSVIKELL